MTIETLTARFSRPLIMSAYCTALITPAVYIGKVVPGNIPALIIAMICGIVWVYAFGRAVDQLEESIADPSTAQPRGNGLALSTPNMVALIITPANTLILSISIGTSISDDIGTYLLSFGIGVAWSLLITDVVTNRIRAARAAIKQAKEGTDEQTTTTA